MESAVHAVIESSPAGLFRGKVYPDFCAFLFGSSACTALGSAYAALSVSGRLTGRSLLSPNSLIWTTEQGEYAMQPMTNSIINLI